MKKNKKNNENQEKDSTSRVSAKMIVKTIFMTIFTIACTIGFSVMAMTSVCPKVTIEVFDYCGFDDANYLVYKRVYARDATNENLYNVIQLAINRKEYEDMEKYIKLMLEGDNFSKFAKHIDGETKKALGEEYSVYVDNYEGYLRSELTLALYNNGNSLEAKMRAIDSAHDDAREMYVYVACVASDKNLTDLQKKTELATLKSKYGIIDELNSLLQELEEVYDLATNTDYDKVSVLEQRIKVAEILEVIETYAGTTQSVQEIQENIKQWNKEIISLLDK